MNNASLNTPTFKMLAVGLSFACSLAYAGTEGYLSTSSAAGTSEVGPTAVYATQSGMQSSITAREAARRREDTKVAQTLLEEGRTAYREGHYSEALDKYRQAWDRVPHAPATRKLQEFIRDSISDASIAVSIEYAKVGRYDDAEQLLLDVLKRNPDNKRARQELNVLRDPVRNNPALTPEHVRDVEEVTRLLTLAWGYYDLGKFNEAYAEFNNVLRIDPYNVAARRGQEAVQQRRSQYYRAAYDSYRAKALAEVDGMWQENLDEGVEQVSSSNQSGRILGGGDTDGQVRIKEQLASTRIARVSFDKTPITDVVEFIRGELRKNGSPMNINFMEPPPAPTAPVIASTPASSSDDDDEDSDEDEDSGSSTAAATPTPVAAPYVEPVLSISELTDVSIADLLKTIQSQTGCVYVVRDNGVYIYTKGDPNSVVLQTRVWNEVPESYLTGGTDGGEEDEGDDEESAFGGKKSAGSRLDAKAALKASAQIDFSAKGSSAGYNRHIQQLIVTNTPEQLEAIEDLIRDCRNKATKMVKVTTKFVEITQANDEELSFDWVVNPFSVSSNGTSYLGGGPAHGSVPSRTYRDFITSGGSGYSNNHSNNGSWPISNSGTYSSLDDAITQGTMTGGLRTGTGAIASSSMDQLLAVGSPTTATTATPAPGILSLSGIYDSGSFQMIMRGLSQKKGVDVMSAPSLVLTPGEEPAPAPVDPLLQAPVEVDGSARIEIVRRFVYPTEYDAPEIPQRTSGWNDDGGALPVAAPANPAEWGVEEVGLVMAVSIKDQPTENVVKFDGFLVRIVDFEGFINYGSPIVSGIANQTKIETVVLTENRIDQPVFSRRLVSTTLSLYDGYTVAIGGMIEDRVQKVEDKVPVFGDLPFIGRFFRSNAESHTRKNLTIFVTADIIDPTGKPARARATSDPTGAATAPGLFPDDALVP